MISYNKKIWPVYILGGFQSLAYSGFFVLVVPLSLLIWPEEPYHALEMGILVTMLLWVSSITGIAFGRLIDKYSRTKILFVISIFRGLSMIFLAFAEEGTGMQMWWYFFAFVFVFALFAGGSYPGIVSLAHDIVPVDHRSRFFGIQGITGSTFTMVGFLVSGFLVQFGYWRFFFSGVGIAILASGLILLIFIKEPKRGAQNEELKEVLKENSVEYDFQIDLTTMKKTMLSKTNLIALIEGVFTQIFMGSLHILILPYIQSPPYNFSPLLTGVFLVVFGLSGGLIGLLLLAKLSDKLSKKKDIRRLYFVVFALTGGAITFVFLFYIPLPHLSKEQGADILFFFTMPSIWFMGLFFLSSSSISALYGINQGPILQEINLPESQAQISSWNQFLEHIGYGAGPLIAGLLISLAGQNYQVVALLVAIFAIPGIVLWIIGIKWYPKDKLEIKKLLEERAEILTTKTQSTS